MAALRDPQPRGRGLPDEVKRVSASLAVTARGNLRAPVFLFIRSDLRLHALFANHAALRCERRFPV
jgi:hypothetical protein